jgi:xanthine dehydrogenase small subunit
VLGDALGARAAAGGSQCGYCTPGFVVSLVAEQYRRGRDGPCDPEALSGNLCRCTGYRPILDAARSVGAAPAGHLRDRLDAAAPELTEIEGPSFSRPASLASAIDILRSDPTAALIAGGTDAAVDNNLRARVAPHIVSVDAIPELHAFAESADAIDIGAALTLTEIGLRWTSAPAAFGEWLELFASPLIRNRATLGGNLATASPIGDAAPLLLALDSSVTIGGPSGARRVPLDDFFTGYRRTALGPGELITSIVIPKPLPAVLRFYKVAKRRLDDISTVAAAFALNLSGARVSRFRMGLGGVAARPLRLRQVDDALIGREWNETLVAAVRQRIEQSLTPMSDHRGSKEYRLAVTSSLLEKFWWETHQ